MGSWSSGTREEVNPAGRDRESRVLEDSAEVDITQVFQVVLYGIASLDAVILCKDSVMDSWTQAKRRRGEKGHPGAEGTDRVLRK
jgi:hypothetical protein